MAPHVRTPGTQKGHLEEVRLSGELAQKNGTGGIEQLAPRQIELQIPSAKAAPDA
jgi:hypothetical protein